jgi:DNA (cytosine-5)-methyltransferase 1
VAAKTKGKGKMNELALFAGAGGGILGGLLCGFRTICAVEIEPYAASVLVSRQNEGFLPPFPIWDDVRTFDGQPWCGIVDVVSGGFPCTDISSAGKGEGITGTESAMWFQMARIIGEVRPPFAFVENSPMLTIRGLERVCGSLAELGYNAEWGIVSAADTGAPHLRERIWIFCWHSDSFDEYSQREIQRRQNAKSSRSGQISHAEIEGLERTKPAWDLRSWGLPAELCDEVADTESGKRSEPQARNRGEVFAGGGEEIGRSEYWNAEPDVGRVVDGVAARVDRLKAIGNGQVPAVVRKAWHVLCQRAAAEHYGTSRNSLQQPRYARG